MQAGMWQQPHARHIRRPPTTTRPHARSCCHCAWRAGVLCLQRVVRAVICIIALLPCWSWVCVRGWGWGHGAHAP